MPAQTIPQVRHTLTMAFALCAGLGLAEPETRTLADTREIPPHSEAALAFDLPAIPGGRQIRIALEARNDWDTLGGSWPTMTVSLNGTGVTGSRLINKPLRFIARNGSAFTWAAGDGNRYRLVHAPDFSDATATDETYEYGTPGTDPFRFVWDVTDLVREGANRLAIQSPLDLNFTLHLRRIAVEIGEPLASANTSGDEVAESYAKSGIAFWDPSMRRDETTDGQRQSAQPAPTGPLPVYQPRMLAQLPGEIDVAPDGAMRLTQGPRTFYVLSRTSLPQGRWTGPAETGETTTWRKLRRGGTAQASWEAGACTVSRKITLHADRLAIADTLTNRSDTLVGVIIENRLALPEKPGRILLAGHPVGEHFRRRASPAHPTAIALFDDLAAGLVAEDDIFRIHVQTFADGDNQAIGLADTMLAIPPGGAHTLEWSLYLAPGGDYWNVVNAIRRNWGSNRTLVGPSKWETPASTPQSLSTLTNWSQMAPVITLCNPRVTPAEARYRGDENVSVQHGPSFLACKTWCRQAHEAAQRIRAANPAAVPLVYTHHHLDNEPGVTNLYGDSRAMTPLGTYGRTAYGGVHALFIPTLENSYGKALRAVYRFILEEIGADIYIDEISASNVTPFGRYAAWDGCTALIDPHTHALRHTLSSAILLMQPWRQALMDEVAARGRRLVTANGAPYTRTMQQWPLIQYFNEADIGNTLAIELHLSHPLCTGQPYGPNSPERILARFRSAHGLLDQGAIQWVSFDAGFPMFPITPVELRSGVIIGRERILTNRSGRFGWGDASEADVIVLDGQARRVAAPDARTDRSGGQVFTDLRMPGDHLAVLVRKP